MISDAVAHGDEDSNDDADNGDYGSNTVVVEGYIVPYYDEDTDTVKYNFDIQLQDGDGKIFIDADGNWKQDDDAYVQYENYVQYKNYIESTDENTGEVKLILRTSLSPEI